MLAWPAGRNRSGSGGSRPSPSRPSVATRPAGCAGGWWGRSPSGPPDSCQVGPGLTVSSVLVAEGQPAPLLGLIDPTSAFFEAMQETGAFVVQVLAVGDRALAERFSEVRPPIRGPFERLQVAESPWGPVLGGEPPPSGLPAGRIGPGRLRRAGRGRDRAAGAGRPGGPAGLPAWQLPVGG
jgi:hypothetical protein